MKPTHSDGSAAPASLAARVGSVSSFAFGAQAAEASQPAPESTEAAPQAPKPQIVVERPSGLAGGPYHASPWLIGILGGGVLVLVIAFLILLRAGRQRAK